MDNTINLKAPKEEVSEEFTYNHNGRTITAEKLYMEAPELFFEFEEDQEAQKIKILPKKGAKFLSVGLPYARQHHVDNKRVIYVLALEGNYAETFDPGWNYLGWNVASNSAIFERVGVVAKEETDAK